MNRKNLASRAVAILLAGAVLAFTSASAHAALLVYQVTATPSNIITGGLLLDIPAINAHPGAAMIITQNYTPTATYNNTYSTGGAETYLNDPVGVRYDTTRKRWFVYDETGASLPVGASFNILVAPSERLLATALNSQSSQTIIPVGRNTPGALLFETHLYNPNLTLPLGVLYPHPAGIGYDSKSTRTPIFQHWFVSSEDATPAEATGWFIFDASPYERLKNLSTFTVSSGAGSNFVGMPISRMSNVTTVETTAGFHFTNSVTDGNANAVVFITHVMTNGAYNQVCGVYFDGAHWCIIGPSFGAAMDVESFNVLAFSTATPL